MEKEGEITTVEKLKVHWVTREHDLVGNALGYNTHNKNMRRHCQKYMDFDDNAYTAMHIVPADQFVPIQGKFNILFSMWEFLDLPDSYIQGIKKADMIVVPCRFCRDLFKKHTDKRVEVCFEGVEASKYPYHPRQVNGRFRFLWVGAPNPRKGYPLILEALKWIEKMPNMEMYIKTTMPQLNWKQTMVNAWKKRKDIFGSEGHRKTWWRSLKSTLRRIPKPYYAGKIKTLGKHKNIFLDSRFLSFEDLVDLYNSAHCFVLPTFGEGWGLTLCEAMATGAPCVATAITGCADFFDETVGYPIDYSVKTQDLKNYKLKSRSYVPDTQSMVKQMVNVATDYKEALRRGKKAHYRINEKFTWDDSARRLNEILRGTENVAYSTC
jgi:glycosyltransferase involved in cell wall biosynthesis